MIYVLCELHTGRSLCIIVLYLLMFICKHVYTFLLLLTVKEVYMQCIYNLMCMGIVIHWILISISLSDSPLRMLLPHVCLSHVLSWTGLVLLVWLPFSFLVSCLNEYSFPVRVIVSGTVHHLTESNSILCGYFGSNIHFWLHVAFILYRYIFIYFHQN
jgi:hypothetical protein